MTPTLKSLFSRKFVQSLLVLTGLLGSGEMFAATVNIASAPLVSATTTQVLPNLMYILDNSGSMGWDYMPDYVNDSYKCKASSGTFSANCTPGDPPYNTKEFNSIYYNPAITYSPGMDSLGAEKPSMTRAYTSDWTQVDVDAYGIQKTDQLGTNISSNKISLVPVPLSAANSTGYPDRVWCNTSSATTADLTDTTKCKKNSQYIYPTSTFSNAYTLRAHPYYYTVAVGEYCANANLTGCITASAPDATHTFPAKLFWCNSSGNCQAKFLQSTGYTRAKWAGAGSSAYGSIKINADPIGLASPVSLSVTNITVDGIRIIPATPSPALTITDTTNTTQRNTLAANIAAAITTFVPSSGDDFTATASGDLVTITKVGAGLFSGTIAVTTTSYTSAATAGVKAVGSFKVTTANSGTTEVGSITVNGIEIMGGSGTGCGTATSTSNSTTGSTRRKALASAIAAKINSCTSSPEYTAVSDGNNTPKITITASAVGAASNGAIVISALTNSPIFGSYINMAGGDNGASKTYTIPTTVTSFTGGAAFVSTFNRVDIEPATTNYPKAATRADCVASSTSCSYDEEMTNFANWYSYYRTRMQMMKTSTSRAFKTIDTRYRVGFITINSPTSGLNYLPIAQFGGAQKTNWYASLVAAIPGSSTPLRTALSTTGRIFAGKKPVGTSDPVQYSCQQNFALLTTDGFWNGGSGIQIDGSTTIGNHDGGTTVRPMYEGSTATSNTLADAAKYYYDIDLRNTGLGNCTGDLGTDVCEDNVFVSPTDNNVKQHMTTFTLGLGVDGELTYTSDYRNASSGDYFDIKQGTKNWTVPVADTQTAVDDLWHAAVNGQGTYFSAKDPNQLNTSLNEALQSIGAKVGAGAAAATSTLNPVAGDNFAYVASYTTVKWTGNLEARDINLDTGEVSEDATWCVENVAASSCAAPSSIVSEDVSGSTVAFCVTPSATAATCPAPGILSGTDCKVEVASACTGAITDNVGPALSSRTILIKDGATNNLVPFTYASLSATQQDHFNSTWLSTNLSQWSSLTPTQQAAAGGASLVNFLRGETGFEDRASNVVGTVDNRLYRFREATMGDALESTPVFAGAEKLNYSDPNYGPLGTVGSYKEAQKNRAGTVYLGTNDGMLHAFNSANGEERWAYVPSMVIPNMYKLADKNYANLHTNYVNGDAIIGSICYANCSVSGSGGAAWKTILVGGLNGGGKGYYALDVTDPTIPTLLWEFTPDNDNDLGISFGNAEITKKADGTWVVLVTSGYNNTAGTNPGKGILYVLNANTGAVISKYSTGAGDVTTPSGLAKISAYVNEPNVNNTADFVYGGDLLGNLWRFDINSAAAVGTNPFKLALLKDSTGTPQPITVRPTLSDVSGKRLIIVGTGKYLEVSDLTNTQQQTLYAMSDDSSVTTTLDNPRLSSTMVSQTLVNNGATRSILQPENTVSYATGRGWYIDLPDSGERQNIPSKFVAGVTLLVPTIVPSNTVCSPGGYGWLNFVNYKTGAVITTNVVASKTNAPIVGINVMYIKGKSVVSVVTADNPTPEKPGVEPPPDPSSHFTDHRMIWRELLEE